MGAILPNPTEVRVVNVKYSDVMYRDCGGSGRGEEEEEERKKKRGITVMVYS